MQENNIDKTENLIKENQSRAGCGFPLLHCFFELP